MTLKKFLTSAAIGAAIGISAVLILTTPVKAQDNCGTTAQADAIVKTYEEIPIISWINDKGQIIMVYANLDRGTSTVFAMRPEGDRVCIVSEGTNVRIGPAPQKPPGKDEL